MNKKAQEIYETIPQGDKDRAETNGGFVEDACWHCGKVALELIEKHAEHKMACYEAVARLYPVSKDTVRERARIFDLVGDCVLMYPQLMYSHWRAACGMNKEYGLPGILEIAAQAEDYFEQWGNLPSVDTIRGWVKAECGEGEDIVYPVYWLRFEKGIENLEAAADDEKFPQRELVREHLLDLKKIRLGA